LIGAIKKDAQDHISSINASCPVVCVKEVSKYIKIMHEINSENNETNKGQSLNYLISELEFFITFYDNLIHCYSNLQSYTRNVAYKENIKIYIKNIEKINKLKEVYQPKKYDIHMKIIEYIKSPESIINITYRPNTKKNKNLVNKLKQ
jgi:hypothetical protein